MADGSLEPMTPPTKAIPAGEALALHKHKEQAIAAQGQSYVVTTVTGSGKSLCLLRYYGNPHSIQGRR